MTKELVISLALLSLILPDTSLARLKPKPAYKVYWQETNGYIQTATVCENYTRSSLEYRECRSYALDLFRDQCRKHRKKLEKAGAATRERERTVARKFCSAASRFSP